MYPESGKARVAFTKKIEWPLRPLHHFCASRFFLVVCWKIHWKILSHENFIFLLVIYFFATFIYKIGNWIEWWIGVSPVAYFFNGRSSVAAGKCLRNQTRHYKIIYIFLLKSAFHFDTHGREKKLNWLEQALRNEASITFILGESLNNALHILHIHQSCSHTSVQKICK